MHWPARKDIWLRRAGEYAPACTAVQYCWRNLAPEVVTKLDEAEREVSLCHYRCGQTIHQRFWRKR